MADDVPEMKECLDEASPEFTGLKRWPPEFTCSPLNCEGWKYSSKTPEVDDPVEELCRIGDAYLKATGLTPDEAIKRIMAEVRKKDVGSQTPQG